MKKNLQDKKSAKKMDAWRKKAYRDYDSLSQHEKTARKCRVTKYDL